ncbi:hypothetical protein [Marinobacter sp. LV10R520-4]|uniref:hypothetical protein n=1 Tax=Marinobacter sp. LV10R520-4 TaxID=1761796 RepID=UPI0010D9C4E1|nr:hypothetical protein [Marinobacter sp. LV10R520-4]
MSILTGTLPDGHTSDLTITPHRDGIGSACLSGNGIETRETGSLTAGISTQWSEKFYSRLTFSVVKSK